MTGGDNEFVDGLHIAKIIRENHPEAWKVLTEVNIDFWDVGSDPEGGDFYKISSLPTFQ